MIRTRFGRWALAATVALGISAREAHGAAEVHRINLILSAIPTQVNATDVNDAIDFLNRAFLESRGLKGLDRITYAWMFESQVRYMVRPNLAVNAGVGQLRNATKREYLPALGQDVQLRFEIVSAPISLGAAYYLQPYNQGDFQARAFLGAGFLSLVQNKVQFQQTVSGFGGSGGTFSQVASGDGPGYYVEGGVHMYFASRFSVVLGGLYRRAKVSVLLDRDTQLPATRVEDGKLFSLDVGGAGARMAIGIGL